MVAGEHLGLDRTQEVPDALLRRIDLERLATVEHGLSMEEAEPVVRTHVDPADAERAPARAAKPVRELPPFPVGEPELEGIDPFDHDERARQLQQDLEALGADLCNERDP